MRIESSVIAISWIPSEAIEGMPKVPFEMGICHYDEPPPDRIAPGDLARLRDEDRFREANDLRAWIEVENGKKLTKQQIRLEDDQMIHTVRLSPDRPPSHQILGTTPPVVA